MKLNAMKIAGTALSLCSLVVLSSCGGKPDQAALAAAMGGQAPELGVMTVYPGSAESENSLPATIKGKTDIDVRPQVTGFITKVHVDEGQRVHKGQPLFTLDQVQFQAAVAQAEAAVNSARTAVSNAELTANNKRQLFEKNIIAEYEWQTANNALQQARAALAQAEASLVNARKNLSYTVVTAPCDGVVGSIPNREGSLASPSSAMPLTTVSDNSQVYAYFSLTEKDILELTQNGKRSLQAAIEAMPPVRLRLSDGTLYEAAGKVSTISGVIDSSTGSASVRALFPNPTGMLRSGSTGNIVFPHAQQNVIVIPQKATMELQDRKFVFVVNDSNKLVATPVVVTANSDGTTYVVNSGLTGGQRIVIEGVGTQAVQDGVVIKPVEGRDPEAQSAAQQAAAAQRPR